MSLPWPAGASTGIGSLPGTDPDEAVRLVLGEFSRPALPAASCRAGASAPT